MLIVNIFAVVGALSCFYAASKVFSFVRFHFWLPQRPLEKYRLDGGSWAVITGSSGGIGFAFAEELVSRGFDVVLHSHLPAELDEAEAALKLIRPGVNVRKFVLDVRKFDDSDVTRLVESVADVPVSILINNVGGAPIEGEQLRKFETLQAADIDYFMSVNARFMAKLTRSMLPALSKHGARSLIINMSSGARVGLPWLHMYSATKAFNHALSCSIAREMRAEGMPIDIVCLSPGDIHSQSNNIGLIPGTPTARVFAKAALDRADTAVSYSWMDVSPWWIHALQSATMEWLPEWIILPAVVQSLAEKREARRKLA